MTSLIISVFAMELFMLVDPHQHFKVVLDYYLEMLMILWL